MATKATASGLAPIEPTDDLRTVHKKSETILARLRDGVVNKQSGLKEAPTFPISKAAELVGRSASAIREAERDKRLPDRDRTEAGYRLPYSLAEIDNMRKVFGTSPRRDESDPTAIIAVSNFKGGVGKSTMAVHLAQDFAMKGYRTLLVDFDSQASTTMMFGYRPDVDLAEEETLYGYFHEKPLDGIRSTIRPTHFHNLHLIPTNLKLYTLEYEIAAYLGKEKSFDIIDIFSEAMEEAAPDYDVIIMDPPPALGMVSLGVLQAANAMVIPMPPSVVDFASTMSFVDMAAETMMQMEQLGARGRPAYNFIRILANRVDERGTMHREVLSMMRNVFGTTMLNNVMPTSAEIDNASSRLQTVFELGGPATSRDVHLRCMKYLRAVCDEVEQEVLATWPSRRAEVAL